MSRFRENVLLQVLTLLLFGPACQASSLGLTVHVVPLDSDGGKTVRAHFSAIAAAPCPSLSGLCAAGEDCLVHPTSEPFNGTKPGSGWCVRQWQKTVPSVYSANISVGSNTEFYVSMNAGPKVRANSGRLNRPPVVGLLPPLRARVNCPHHFHLSVKDLDGDVVRCRFAQPGPGECLRCTQHPFIELDEEKCMLTFTGRAPAGQYFIHLMVEDLIPAPKISFYGNQPLSAVPVHLSLTVEESSTSCTDEPVAAGETPEEDSTLFVLPYQEVAFHVSFMSQAESVLEVAVVGPPELYRVGFKTVGPLALMTMAWIRSENNLTQLLPVCFAVNTQSLQSEPRCVWLYQREMRTLPAGTELKCDSTEMILSLPVSSLSNIDLAELQLNSPTCPVAYNSTHLSARVSLDGCGTKRVHSGSELVYTNTLKSVRPYTKVSRQPSLILPLACRIPGVQATGPNYQISLPSEMETFGPLRIWIEVLQPGEGPMAEFTRNPKFRSRQLSPERSRREAESLSKSHTSTNSSSTSGAVGSRINQLDLHVMSNCSIEQAEMIVSNCIESETQDFAESQPILQQGCTTSNTLEVVTSHSSSKIYRMDLSKFEAKGSTMYIRCTLNLCIATMSSLRCPDLCSRSLDHRSVVGSVFTRSYTVDSAPISLVVTTAAPSTTAAVTTKQAIVALDPTSTSSTSHAPEQASAVAAGVIFTTMSVFLQNVFFY